MSVGPHLVPATVARAAPASSRTTRDARRKGGAKLVGTRKPRRGNGAADIVHDEPADGTGERVEAGRQDVAEKAEGAAALHHHRNPELRAERREGGVRKRPQGGAG